jgi:hypothetical protein
MIVCHSDRRADGFCWPEAEESWLGALRNHGRCDRGSKQYSRSMLRPFSYAPLTRREAGPRTSCSALLAGTRLVSRPSRLALWRSTPSAAPTKSPALAPSPRLHRHTDSRQAEERASRAAIPLPASPAVPPRAGLAAELPPALASQDSAPASAQTSCITRTPRRRKAIPPGFFPDCPCIPPSLESYRTEHPPWTGASLLCLSSRAERPGSSRSRNANAGRVVEGSWLGVVSDPSQCDSGSTFCLFLCSGGFMPASSPFGSS